MIEEVNMNAIGKLTAAVVCALVLTACGGGGEDDAPVPANDQGSNGNTSTSPSNSGSGNNASAGGSSASGATDSGSGTSGTQSGNTPTSPSNSGSGNNASAGGGSASGATDSGSGTSGTQSSYTVTPSVNGSGGTINPAIAVPVKSGSATSFQVTPNSGYTASVGGTCQGTLSGTTYTTKAIAADCSVVAAFHPRTFSYETQPNPPNSADFLKLLNQEGAKGYFYFFDNNNNNFSTHGLASLAVDYPVPFVNDSTGQTYSYEVLEIPTTMADFITQANTEGAKGYHYDGRIGWVVLNIQGSLPANDVVSAGVLYRKDSGSSATYTYASEPVADSLSGLVDQANILGQSGYLLMSIGGLGTPEQVGVANLYMKNTTSGATYTYEANTASITTSGNLLAQLNSQGTKGYRTLPGRPGRGWQIYVKDQSQNATFAYQAVSDQSGPQNLTVEQMNRYGAQGYAYWGYVTLDATFAYYVKANNCMGLLCTVLSPTVINVILK
jgi:hypothetical protein